MPKRYPGFSQRLSVILRISLDLFLEDVVWSRSSRFSSVVSWPIRCSSMAGWPVSMVKTIRQRPVSENLTGCGERAGILSHPYLMACFAYTATSSPIHRGVFIARNLLGRSLARLHRRSSRYRSNRIPG